MTNLPGYLPTAITLGTGLFAFLQKDKWKKVSWILFCVLAFSGYAWVSQNIVIRDQAKANNDLKIENERLINEKKSLEEKFNILGVNIESGNDPIKTVEDFKKNWDYSDFNLIGKDTFCPRKTGDNLYQRLTYKNDTPLAASDLKVKFQMVDREEGVTEYNQRFVVGMKTSGSVIAEFDLPTRLGQVVNYRIPNESGELVPGGSGQAISSPIEDHTPINIWYSTKYNQGQEITQTLSPSYISSVKDYGTESDSISNPSKVIDPNPLVNRVNVFIDSYAGGCIKILNWQVN